MNDVAAIAHAPAAVSTAGGGDSPAALGDSDDDFQYEEVKVESEEDDDISEDLDAALRSLQTLTAKAPGAPQASQPAGSSTRPAPVGAASVTAAAEATQPPPGGVVRRPEAVDDFLRNFFARKGMSRTAEAFEAEWYELKSTGRLLGASPSPVPDVYVRNTELEEGLGAMRAQLTAAQNLAERASSTWERLRRERDYHRLHHQRVAQEKNKLITDIKRLKAHYSKYEPTILELKRKYEAEVKEKALAALERDKMAAKAHALEERLAGAGLLPRDVRDAPKSPTGARNGARRAGSGSGSPLPATGGSSSGTNSPLSGSAPRQQASWPGSARTPVSIDAAPAPVHAYKMQQSFTGHLMSVAALALHPSKPILVTASDDKSWKMWALPGGELIMCGEGHRDWVAGVDFHPSSTSLASGSGDATVKVWLFEAQRCTATFAEHKQAVWAVHWHHQGEWLASSSLDHTVRLWDAVAGRCRQVLRGHIDSVNDVHWQPGGSVLATASSDKTVSTWDVRSGLVVQTFYGHRNSCNSAVYSANGGVIATTDADGVVKLWEARMGAEILTIQAGQYPANKAAFDASGTVLAVPSDDGSIKCYDARTGAAVCELQAHEDAVQAVAFDGEGQFMVSGASDNTFKLWS